MQDTLISIVTTSFNSERTIAQTMDSILAQTYTKIEYLIIDGKSSDSTLSIVEGYRSRFEEKEINLKVVSEKDKGIYDGMNKGIALATGEIIGIVNSDDWLESDALETVVESYQKDHFDILLGDINIVENGKIKFVKHARVKKFKTSRDFCHPAMFVTKETYNSIGVYDLGLWYADFDFWLRAFRKGRKLVVAGKVLSNYRLGGVSTKKKTIKQTLERVNEKYACYKKNSYSRLYYFECLAMEFGKYMYASVFGS